MARASACPEDVLLALERRGYRYDASTLPTFIGPLARAFYFRNADLTPEELAEREALFGSFRDGTRPLKPYRWALGDGLIEVPVTTMPLLRTPIHMSYLMYLGERSPALAHRLPGGRAAAVSIDGSLAFAPAALPRFRRRRRRAGDVVLPGLPPSRRGEAAPGGAVCRPAASRLRRRAARRATSTDWPTLRNVEPRFFHEPRSHPRASDLFGLRRRRHMRNASADAKSIGDPPRTARVPRRTPRNSREPGPSCPS